MAAGLQRLDDRGGEAALLHQPGDDAETAAAGRRLEISGFVAVGIENSADVDALDQILASFDVIGEIVETYCDTAYLDGDNVDIAKLSPILFTMDDRGYWSVGERFATAWEAGKELKAK